VYHFWSILYSQFMYLEKWCHLTNTSRRSLAKKLGDISATSVARWTNSKRFPKPKDLIRIIKITDGAVTPNDFVEQWAEHHGEKEI